MIKLEFSNFAALLEEKQICVYLYDPELKLARYKNLIFDGRFFDEIVEKYGDYYVTEIGSDSGIVSCTLIPPDGWDEFTEEE